MLHRSGIAICVVAALAAAACSTRPRQFSASVRPVDPARIAQSGEAADFANCDQMVRGGRSNGFTSAAATGVVGGAAALGGAVAVGTSGLVGSSISAAGAAAAAAMPVFGFAAAFGVNRMIRSGKERKYKRLMSACMHEFGYEVVDWSKAAKKQQGTATLASAATPAVVAPNEPASVTPDASPAPEPEESSRTNEPGAPPSN